jgi:hypothetical protein
MIEGDHISFLVGGGCDHLVEYVELLVDGIAMVSQALDSGFGVRVRVRVSLGCVPKPSLYTFSSHTGACHGQVRRAYA